MKTNSILQPKRILYSLSAVAILGATSCTYNDRNLTDTVSDMGSSTLARQDYVYYPDHNVYYNRGADNFRTYEGNRWVTQTTPRNVTREAVLSTESVSIEKYGTPERHYTEYVQPNMTSGSRSLDLGSTSTVSDVRTVSSRSSSSRAIQ